VPDSPNPAATPNYPYRRRANEQVFEVPVTSVFCSRVRAYRCSAAGAAVQDHRPPDETADRRGVLVEDERATRGPLTCPKAVLTWGEARPLLLAAALPQMPTPWLLVAVTLVPLAGAVAAARAPAEAGDSRQTGNDWLLSALESCRACGIAAR